MYMQAGWQAHTFKSVLDGTLTIFAVTMAIELLLFAIGIRGAALYLPLYSQVFVQAVAHRFF